MKLTNLRSVTLNVTNSCNLNCVYCYEKFKNNKYMSLDTMKKAIEEVYRRRDKTTDLNINFFGGEPSLNWKNIKELIKYELLKKRKFYYSMTTNFTYDYEISDLELLSKVNFGFLVSIDGDKKTHDHNRSNSYDKVIENINKFIEYGLGSRIQVRMTIAPDRAKYLFKDTLSIINLGIKGIVIIPVTDQDWTEKQIKNLRHQFRKISKYMYKRYVKNSNFDVHIKHFDDILLTPAISYLNDEPLFNKCGIFEGYNIIIDCDEKVYRCHQMPTTKQNDILRKIFYYGTLDDFQKDTIENNTKFIRSEYRQYKTLDKRDNCINCIARFNCNGPCPIESTKKYNNPSVMNHINCVFNRLLVEENIFITKKLKNNNTNIMINKKFESEMCLKLLEKFLKTPIQSKKANKYLKEFKDFLNKKQDYILPIYKKQINLLIIKLLPIIKDIKNDCK